MRAKIQSDREAGKIDKQEKHTGSDRMDISISSSPPPGGGVGFGTPLPR